MVISRKTFKKANKNNHRIIRGAKIFMALNKRKERFRNFHYLVEIDGAIQAGFNEAAIPNVTSDFSKIKRRYIEKSPVLIKQGTLTLKQGITDSIELFSWRKLAEQGINSEARKNIAIILTDEMGNTAARWELGGAWPSKYDSPTLNAKGNDVDIETLEIAFETLEKVE
jgi:phage tail-like protein